MPTYSAYIEVFETFPTFEAAVEHLRYYPGNEGREPATVTLLTDTTSAGANAELVDGEPAEEGESQAYLVRVVHEVVGKQFSFEYIIEYTEVENGEDGTDGFESGPGDEEGVEQPDEGSEQPGDGSGEAVPLPEEPEESDGSRQPGKSSEVE